MVFNQDHYYGKARKSSIHNQQDAKIRITHTFFLSLSCCSQDNKLPEGTTSLELVPLSVISLTSVYISQESKSFKELQGNYNKSRVIMEICKPIGIACYLLFVRKSHFPRSV